MYICHSKISKSLKIVLVGTANPYRGGGISTFNERLALEFQLQGHDIVIYNFTLQYPNFLFPGTSQYKDVPTEDVVPTYRKVNTINPFNWIKIGWELYKMKPDMILFRYWISFMAPCFGVIAMIAKLNGVSTIYSIIDNVVPHEKRFFDTLFTKFFISACDQFLIMNKTSQSDLMKLTQKPILLEPHPIYDNFGDIESMDVSRKKLQLDSEDFIVLFFGFIRDYKGLDLILEAMADESIKAKRIKLLVAGEFYGNEEFYMNLYKKLGLENIIWRTEFIKDDDVKYYFGASNCVILPYKNATQSGITQVAFHFLKPMIATNVGGLGDFVKDNYIGYLTEPNPSSLAHTILKYVQENKELEFIEHLKVEKKLYSWERFVKRIIETIVR